MRASIQPECRCANDFPRNQYTNSTMCVRNVHTDPSLIEAQTSRLNEFAHPLEFINDGNFKTSWISCILTLTNSISIEIDLINGIYLVQRMEIFFTSLPPTLLLVEKYLNGQWSLLQAYSIACDGGTNSSCIQLPAYIDDK